MSDADLVTAFVDATSEASQEDAAALVGVSQRTISSWRRGSRPRLRKETRRALARFLNGGGNADRDGSEDGGAGRAIELLYASVRAAVGKSPDMDRTLLIDEIETAIELAKEWGWETGRLHELLSRLERGDV